MICARCLKRVSGIEIEACVRCGGQLRIIASIEEPTTGEDGLPDGKPGRVGY
jgi:rRNA maturation endonuclease Nob1